MDANPPLQFGFQGTTEPNPCTTVESPATLLIKHLPDAIPHETLSRLLSHYGASSVRPCSGGRYHSRIYIPCSNSFVFIMYEITTQTLDTTLTSRHFDNHL